ncbi:HEPN domain-containing protein [Mediterraneibacter sp.]|uniref:HEPN domain-containing protein n=1 Tax=Mediterraneibacter sp. TaxID=2316022 RepID=UPI0027B99375|nr:HEPN domain-containing protein [Mediterraneibacter sp.]
MESSLRELAGYRMERAKEMLSAAEDNLKIGQYKTSLNRSYYAIFHAMRAMNILKGFDSSKHSGVIAYFNKEYIKEGIMDKELSVIIKSCSFLREKSDYDDFFIVGRKETENQLASAKVFLEAVEKYLTEKE